MTDNTRIWAERLIAVARGADPHVVPYDPDLVAQSRHYYKVALEGAKWSFRIAVETWLAALGEAKPARVVMLHSERGAPTRGRAGLLGLLQVRLTPVVSDQAA